MDEETAFWGVAVEGYDEDGHPTSVLLAWTGTAHDSEPFRVYRVFDFKEEAAGFVWRRFEHLGDPGFTKHLVENNIQFRKIKRNDIPDEHRVFSERKGLVTWVELLAEGE
jgi:hypothetical protein